MLDKVSRTGVQCPETRLRLNDCQSIRKGENVHIQADDARKGPDFVGIGCTKCGSTWLSYVLAQHPDIYIKLKEIYFFSYYYHKGYDWYHTYFEERGTRLAGEITPDYVITPRPDSSHREFYPKYNPRNTLKFWRPKAPSARDELKARYPDVKIFSIYRNPADRAWSYYWFWRHRKEKLNKRVVPFESMFRDDGRWIKTQGFFARYLAHWREAFPDMGVFFYDDIKTDPIGLVQSTFRFLGVDDSFRPKVDEVILKGDYNPMPDETRAMLADTYREEILRFSDMTGRDLSHWLDVPQPESSPFLTRDDLPQDAKGMPG